MELDTQSLIASIALILTVPVLLYDAFQLFT